MRAVKTEPCGMCRSPVEIDGREFRSRYANRPLCGNCGPSTAAVFYDHETRFRPPVYFRDAGSRRSGHGYADRQAFVREMSASAYRAQVLAELREAGVDPADEYRRLRAEADEEQRRRADEELRAIIQRRDADLAASRYPTPEVYVPADWEEREYADTGAEVRAYVDGEPVFGPEPDGDYLEGRSYAGRWWVEGLPADEVRGSTSACCCGYCDSDALVGAGEVR